MRNLNFDPYCYHTNSIHINNKFNKNNDNLSNNLRDSIDEDTLRHTFRYGLKDCQSVHVINVISTTTNRLYECFVLPGSTWLMTTPKCGLLYHLQ